MWLAHVYKAPQKPPPPKFRGYPAPSDQNELRRQKILRREKFRKNHPKSAIFHQQFSTSENFRLKTCISQKFLAD
jgi:hypothetical protein